MHTHTQKQQTKLRKLQNTDKQINRHKFTHSGISAHTHKSNRGNTKPKIQTIRQADSSIDTKLHTEIDGHTHTHTHNRENTKHRNTKHKQQRKNIS